MVVFRGQVLASSSLTHFVRTLLVLVGLDRDLEGNISRDVACTLSVTERMVLHAKWWKLRHA